MQNKPGFLITNIANALSALRAVLSVVLLFLKTYSLAFYFVFVIAAATDALDGAAARKLRTRSKNGELLDTVADFIFTVVCAYKFIPVMNFNAVIWVWIGIIAAAKIALAVLNFLAGAPLFTHSFMNKVCGVACFLFLLFSDAFINNIIAIPVCIIASVAAYLEWKPVLGLR